MKKLLLLLRPLPIALMSLLIVSVMFRYYLTVNTEQLTREFKNQNFRELYSQDTFKVTTRLNSLSSVINWVCIEAKVDNHTFYSVKRGDCKNGLFQQRNTILIPEANNTSIFFTVRLPLEAESFFLTFLGFQILLIFALIKSTRKAEENKRSAETKINKMALQMSHDIRSPLASLNSLLGEAKEISIESRELMQKSLNRINDISNQLLSNRDKKFITEDTLPSIKQVKVIKSLEEIVNEKILEFKNNSKISIILKTKLNYNEVCCYIDEIEFKRSISNLINNAVEAYNGFRPKLEILIEVIVDDNNDLIISINDNGKGIPSNILNMLGTLEFTTKKNGNGLGIYHAYENFKNWNGKLVTSSVIDVGTTIKIYLPKIPVFELNILIDNDELVRLTWESKAKNKNIHLRTFRNSIELFSELNNISTNSVFYIDSELDNEKGEDIAKKLFIKGYLNLNMCSGHPAINFKSLTFIKSVISKSPPF